MYRVLCAGVFFQTSSSVLSSFSKKHIEKTEEDTMVFLMIRATVFLLFIVELDVVVANTVTSAKVLEKFAFIFIHLCKLSREILS